jgi:aminoglycoside phosphotransferase (APT) family kinase protein
MSEALLVPVLPNHRFDETALVRHLRGRLPGFDGKIVVRQFQGGQSNPTFHLATPAGNYVLRKKPPGKLLPSAHAVDREFQVMKALEGSGVPVPRMRLLCEDDGVIGQMFFVMDHVQGRVFNDRLLPGCTKAERAALYDETARVLATLHKVDYRAVGLERFGKPQGYIARQVSRWARQYEASKVEENPAMDNLVKWLEGNLPATDEESIVHGDYRIGNLIFHPTESRVVAVLDWELATLGHPLSDLGYCCISWHSPPGEALGLSGTNYRELGIPDEAGFLAAYKAHGGRPLEHWDFFLIFSLFRSAAIRAGVYRRALDGNAADARGREIGGAYRALAETGWALVRDRG